MTGKFQQKQSENSFGTKYHVTGKIWLETNKREDFYAISEQYFKYKNKKNRM